MDFAEDYPVPKMSGLCCMFSCPCCVLPALICLIGTAAVLPSGLYAEGGSYSEFVLKHQDATDFVLFAPDKAISSAGPSKYKLVEINPDTWGFDAGQVNLGGASIADVKHSASMLDGHSSTETFWKASELEKDEKKYYVIGGCKGFRCTWSDTPQRIRDFTTKVTFCVIGFLILKSYKYFLLAVMINPNLDDGIPTKLYQFYIDTSDWSDRNKFIFNCFWFPVDYVLLTWGANLALLPLTSIRSADGIQNLAYMTVNLEVWTLASWSLFVGILCYIVLLAADTWNRQEAWPMDSGKAKCIKCILFLFRVLLFVVMAGSLIVSIMQLCVDFKIFFGFDITLVFSFSVRFGLVAWSSFLRFFLGGWTFFETVLTVEIYSLKARPVVRKVRRVVPSTVPSTSMTRVVPMR